MGPRKDTGHVRSRPREGPGKSGPSVHREGASPDADTAGASVVVGVQSPELREASVCRLSDQAAVLCYSSPDRLQQRECLNPPWWSRPLQPPSTLCSIASDLPTLVDVQFFAPHVCATLCAAGQGPEQNPGVSGRASLCSTLKS